MSERLIHKSIEIDAPIEAVWKVLTDSELIPQYMFGCNAETDWKPGSPLLWRGAADHKLYVKGHIVSFDTPRRLAYTCFDPNSTIADVPANYLTMTYDLKKRDDRATTLEITQCDFSKVAEGERRYNDSMGGGDFVLDAIKKLAEAQPAAR